MKDLKVQGTTLGACLVVIIHFEWRTSRIGKHHQEGILPTKYPCPRKVPHTQSGKSPERERERDEKNAFIDLYSLLVRVQKCVAKVCWKKVFTPWVQLVCGMSSFRAKDSL